MTEPVMEFKDVATVPALDAAAAEWQPGPLDNGQSDTIIAVTGIVDEVKDSITPGAFARTLAKRNPKVCFGHDWNRPIGRNLAIKELMPGDPNLPATTSDGSPWPEGAGAVIARPLLNLEEPDGLRAYRALKFFAADEEKGLGNEATWSIGYKATRTRQVNGVRHIDELDLYEYSPVLHPANRLATMIGIKSGEGPDGLETKVRKVKDQAYWGYPVGTPITAHMRPRGVAAQRLRTRGILPSRNVGTTTSVTAEGKPAPARPTDKARVAAAHAEGLFPEPDSPARLKARNPKGKDEQHVSDLVSALESSDSKDQSAREESDQQRTGAYQGLLDEGITPDELAQDLGRAETPNGVDESDWSNRVEDAVAEYRAAYRRETSRQQSGGDTGGEQTAPEGQDQGDGGEPDMAKPAPEQATGGQGQGGDTAPTPPSKPEPTTPQGQNNETPAPDQEARAAITAAGLQVGQSANHEGVRPIEKYIPAPRARNIGGTTVRSGPTYQAVATLGPDGKIYASYNSKDRREVPPEAVDGFLKAAANADGKWNSGAALRAVLGEPEPEPEKFTGIELPLTRPKVMQSLLLTRTPGARLMRGSVQVSDPDAFEQWLNEKANEKLPRGSSTQTKSKKAAAGDLLAALRQAREKQTIGDQDQAGGSTATGPAKSRTVPLKQRDLSELTDEELAAHGDRARSAAFTTLNGSPKNREAMDAQGRVRDEQARRADAARRTVPAHPLSEQDYRAASDQAMNNRFRAQDIASRKQDVASRNAAADQAEQVAASAPEKIEKAPEGSVLVAGGRVALKNPGKASWTLATADGKTFAGSHLFDSGSGRSVKLNKAQADSLAQAVADITDAQGNKIPLTAPDSSTWVPGFRDAKGRDTQGAIMSAIRKWADDHAFRVSPSVHRSADAPSRPARLPEPGVADESGFLPGERAEDIHPGDQVRLPGGSVHTVSGQHLEKNGREVSSRNRDYGVVSVLDFTDGSTYDMGMFGRVDVKPAEGRDPNNLRNPGMGFTSASDIGQPLNKWNPQDQRSIDSANPDPVPAGTRIMYTPDHGEYGDNRPRVGQITDRWTNVQGHWWQVAEYDDGTFDAINARKLADDGKLTIDPSPQAEDDARKQWSAPSADQGQGSATGDGQGFDASSVANRVAAGSSGALGGLSADQLSAVDNEMTNRAAKLGKPGQVSPAHQRVKDALKSAQNTPGPAATEKAPAPSGEEIAREQIEDAEATVDAAMGLTEDPDGNLEVDQDVADRQDRVENLINQADSLDLASQDDATLQGQRRDLVDELRLQNAIAQRDRTQGGGQQNTGDGGSDQTGGTGGEETGNTDTGTAPEDTGPKRRPGVAGAAEDLADALEGDDPQARADAIARMESSLRRSRSESAIVAEMLAAAQRDGGLAAAIEAGDVSPDTLRKFAADLRDERRQQRNTAARNRRAAKRLERDRIRSLIGQYDAELRRRNLNPEDYGGAPPSVDGEPPATPAGPEIPVGAEGKAFPLPR